MRIVHVANFYGATSGGLRTTMHALALGYAEAGHEAVMVVPGAVASDERTPYGRRITLAGARLPFSGGYRVITDVDWCCTVLDGLAPDRLEVSDRATLRCLGWWARQRGVPSLAFAHERLDGVLRAFSGGLLPARMLADWHNRGTAALFDQIAATTSFAAEEFDRIGATNVVRVPLGVDLETFAPERCDPALRRRLAPDGPLLVLASRLSREKRPDLAVSALRELRRRGSRAALAIAGTGPLDPALRRAAQDLPVTFLGFVESRAEMARLLATADVVLAPGPIETYCLAALEALASGTPVVASATSGVREVLGDGCGALTDPTPARIADGVEAVLGVPPRARSAAARTRAEELPWRRTVAAALATHGVTGAAVVGPPGRG